MLCAANINASNLSGLNNTLILYDKVSFTDIDVLLKWTVFCFHFLSEICLPKNFEYLNFLFFCVCVEAAVSLIISLPTCQV